MADHSPLDGASSPIVVESQQFHPSQVSARTNWHCGADTPSDNFWARAPPSATLQTKTPSARFFCSGRAVEPELEPIINAYHAFRAEVQQDDCKEASINFKIKYRSSRKLRSPGSFREKLARGLSQVLKPLHRPLRPSSMQRQMAWTMPSPWSENSGMASTANNFQRPEFHESYPHSKSEEALPSTWPGSQRHEAFIEAPGDEHFQLRAPYCSPSWPEATEADGHMIHELHGSTYHPATSFDVPEFATEMEASLPLAPSRWSSSYQPICSPAVSSFSSIDDSTQPTGSRQFSGSSMISALTQDTSISLQTTASGSVTFAQPRKLALNTSQLSVPPGPFFDRPVTDSPTDEFDLGAYSTLLRNGSLEGEMITAFNMPTAGSEPELPAPKIEQQKKYRLNQVPPQASGSVGNIIKNPQRSRTSQDDALEALFENCNAGSWDLPFNAIKPKRTKRKRAGSVSSAGSVPSVFTCELCKKPFNNRSNCRRHRYNSKLHGAAPLPCPFCGKTDGLLRTYCLKGHLLKEHGYVCEGRVGSYTLTSIYNGKRFKTVGDRLEEL